MNENVTLCRLYGMLNEVMFYSQSFRMALPEDPTVVNVTLNLRGITHIKNQGEIGLDISFQINWTDTRIELDQKLSGGLVG